jgi:hypothetical protein
MIVRFAAKMASDLRLALRNVAVRETAEEKAAGLRGLRPAL